LDNCPEGAKMAGMPRGFSVVLLCAWGCARAPAEPGLATGPDRAPAGLAPAPPASAPVRDAAAELGESPGFLKGQTHVHTGRSYDAKTPPAEVLGFYAERGYDFVAITDHNRVTVIEPPPGLLLVPGVELTQNSASCEPRPAPGYRCLFHTTALFVDPARDGARGERFSIPYRPGRFAAYESQVALARELGGVPVVNHPLFHFAADARTLARLAKGDVRLVELFNASLDRQFPGGRTRAEERAETLWDEVLSGGSRLYALATDDSHHFADAAERRQLGKFAYDGDRAWVMVRADKRPDSIQSALLDGDFYASTGVVLAELVRSSGSIRLRIEANSPAGYRTRFVGTGGRVLAEAPGLEARHAVGGGERYLRAVVEGPAGERAWVQPVFR
jgi:hypothetical protein